MLEALVLAMTFLFPKYLDEETARLHVASALAAEEETGIPASVLLGQAYFESRFNQYSFSRMECTKSHCTRVTGVWTQEKPPGNAKPTYYCGVLQVGGAISWDECRDIMLDIPGSYMKAADELVSWSKYPKCRKLRGDDKIGCALSGFGAGNYGLEVAPIKYATSVLHMSERIVHTAESRVVAGL